MKLRKMLIIAFVVFTTGCSTRMAVGIDPSNPDRTAETIQELIGSEEEIEVEITEWSSGLRKTYKIDDHSSLFLDESEEQIEQMNFRNLTETNVRDILEILEFPEVDSFERMLSYSQDEIDNYNEYTTTDKFTNYQGVGVNLGINTPDSLNAEFFGTTNPYDMYILFNEEAFERFEK